MSLDCFFGSGFKQEALSTEALSSIIPVGNTIFLTTFVEKLPVSQAIPFCESSREPSSGSGEKDTDKK